MRVLGVVIALALAAAGEACGGSKNVVGPAACASCHARETDVWKGTQHFKSFEAVEKNPKHKEILAAAGGGSMRTSPVCTLCHYTVIRTTSGKPIAKAGPSCESCHGPAAGWVKVHGDFGRNCSSETEAPAHRADRLNRSRAAGMLPPSDLYGIASNCANCHGFAHPDLPTPTLEKMLAAGHPLEPAWELVRYSQGTVRHRFYPVGGPADNRELTPPERTRMFVIGQAARLVCATRALEKTRAPSYRAAQEKRIAEARDALAPIANVPAVAALLARPTDETGRGVASAVAGKDFTRELAGKLPDPATYK